MKKWVAIALLAGVTVVIYANTLFNGFAGDDGLYIFQNRAVRVPSLPEFFRANENSNVFRPVTFASFAANFAAGHMHAFGYHAVNLLLECGVVALLFLLLCRLLESVAAGETIALAAALLFAVHPIHTEAVASVVGRAELFAAGFLFAALIFHLNDRPIPALLCFAGGLLSKESAVVFLPLVIVVDLARGKLKPASRYAWIGGLTAVYLAVLWKAQGGHFGDPHINYLDNPLVYLPVHLRILNALRIAWKYVGLLVYPGTLSADYSYNAIPLYGKWSQLLPAALATAAAFGVWIWALVKKRTAWAVAGAIYLIGFAVTANILIPTGTIMGERLAYFSSAGFCLAAGLAWYRLSAWKREVAWVTLTVVLVALGLRTMARNSDWRNNRALDVATVAAVPDSAKARVNFAGIEIDEGQYDDARQQLRTALKIYPDFSDAYEAAGLLESRLGHEQRARQLLQTAFDMSYESEPQYRMKSVNLAGVLAKEGDTADALRLLNHAIEMSPPFAKAYAERAVLRYKAGDLAGARTDAQMAAETDPENSEFAKLVSLFSASK
jgi:protein O-mannosyl-transferase